jgi:hypothetical protein
LFRGDCLQVAIDPEADASKGYDEDDFELGFALTPAGVEQVVYYDRKGRSFDALDVAIQHDDDARIYEIAIPRTLLQQTNTGSGQMQRIGFNVLIGYGKGDDRYGWIDWTPGIGEEKSPMLYHTLVLPPIPE